MNTRIIAFTGLAGSGKTTAAMQLCAKGWVRVSFAEPLRQMLLALGLTEHQMRNEKNTPIEWLGGKTPRQLMQTIGTEWGRQLVCDNIWTSAARRTIETTLSWEDVAGVVIDDCRFANEAEMVRQMGGLVIELRRQGTQQMSHASEGGVPPYLIDSTIVNNDLTPEQLLDAVVGVYADTVLGKALAESGL